MEPAPNNEPTRQPPPGINIPPGYEYITVGDMPKEFTHGVLMRAFTAYAVALGLERNGSYFPIGSGVLVRKGTRHGILTAHHCLHACSPEVRLGSEDGDRLWLVLERGREVKVKPQEVIEHPLTKPNSDAYGPDLTFIEILSIERLGTFKAVGSFWSLDEQPEKVVQAFGNPLTPIVSTGFPAVHHNTVKATCLKKMDGITWTQRFGIQAILTCLHRSRVSAAGPSGGWSSAETKLTAKSRFESTLSSA